jgi:ribonuclease M5
MIRLNEAVVVEGKYDKIKLSNFIDAEIIVTDGFRIFKDKQKCDMIRRIAEKRGIMQNRSY